jgi:ribosomal protein S12 methylthiotransferase
MINLRKQEALTKGNKIHFTSLGCPRNLVDTEVMLGILLQAGYEITDQIEEADYLIVNTCGFLAAAREEACQTLTALFQDKNPTAKIIATGCMVQQHSAELKNKYPQIHYFLGSGNPDAILEALTSEVSGESITSAKSFLEMGNIPRKTSTPKHYAYLKIAEGCRKRCSYCIIPEIKGPLKSKTIEQILKEFKSLLNQGVREVILIAQDLGDFGKDRQEKTGLTDLLETLLTVKGDYWIRLLYLYPDEITDEMIALMKQEERLCNYLDMPIQHVNNELLKAMHRKTNKQQITSTIKKLRKEIPEIIIRTSLIVGFPGETEEQFQELYNFLKHTPLDQVGIFQYSQEEGSVAAKLPNQIPDSVKKKRYEKLMKLQQKNVDKKTKKMIGKTLRVLIDGYHPETNSLMVGRYFGQCPDIDSSILLNNTENVDSFSQMYTVEITDSAGYDLVGSVICKDEVQHSPLALTT